MQSAPARSRWQSWQSRLRALVLGIVLGLLQILLVWGWELIARWPFSWLLFGALSLFFYLAISALDGFLASRQNQETSSGFPPGFIVGGIAFLVEGITFVAAPAIVLTPLLPIVCPPGSCRGLSAGIGGFFILVIISAFFLLEALLVGPLGGWIGGVLAQRWASRPKQSSTTAEEQVH